MLFYYLLLFDLFYYFYLRIIPTEKTKSVQDENVEVISFFCVCRPLKNMCEYFYVYLHSLDILFQKGKCFNMRNCIKRPTY